MTITLTKIYNFTCVRGLPFSLLAMYLPLPNIRKIVYNVLSQLLFLFVFMYYYSRWGFFVVYN